MNRQSGIVLLHRANPDPTVHPNPYDDPRIPDSRYFHYVPFRMQRVLTIVFLLAAAFAAPLHSQVLPANARLPLQHWAVPFLEHLVDRGVMGDPTPLLRPWRVGVIAEALAEADTTRMNSAEIETRRRILETLQQRSSEKGIVVGGDVSLVASTHQRRARFSLRPVGDDRITPEVSGAFGFWFGPAMLLVHARYDDHLYDDPEFAGALDQAPLRTDEAYGSYESRYLGVELGSMSRNWGPTGLPGLLLSDWPLSYDHLLVRLGPPRVSMNVLVTQLDDALDRQGEVARRFFIAHRLRARLFSWLELAVWQGTVLAGPNRNLELQYLNPIQPTYFTAVQHNELNANFMFGGDGWMRLGGWVLSGSMFFDDWDVTTGEPPALAFTGTASTSIGAASLWLGYTLVGNLAYNTNDPAQKPLVAIAPSRGRFGTGLARNYSDYDQLTARVSLVPMPGVIVTPELALLRQGEGDMRVPYPRQAELDTVPVLFMGTVERTWRVALASRLALPLGLEASLNAGVHFVQNANHQAGSSRTDFVGTIRVQYGVRGLWPFE